MNINSNLKDKLKRIIVLRWLFFQYKGLLQRDFFCKRATVNNKGYGRFCKRIEGKENHIIIGNNTYMNNPMFYIRGNNNTIIIGEECKIGKKCSFWMEGNNIKIIIGSKTTFTQFCHFNAQEEGSEIIVGHNCMFSNHIIVRTSDSHPIYDMISGKRINSALSVYIGNNVWVAPDTKIMKGADIQDGCIVGSNTLVSKYIPAHSLVVGMPARVVKSNVKWTREDVLFHKIM